LSIFPTPLLFGAPFPTFPLEFHSEVNQEETRLTGLLCGESCMILTSTVLDWSTRATDRQTDGRTDWHAIAYVLSHAKKCTTLHCLLVHQVRALKRRICQPTNPTIFTVSVCYQQTAFVRNAHRLSNPAIICTSTV